MTREEIIKYLNIIKAFFLGSEHQPISDAYFALDEAIKALEQKTCDYYDPEIKTCRRSEVPPKTGHWIYSYGIRYCEFCGASNSTAYANYCPNCGAKMESEDKE